MEDIMQFCNTRSGYEHKANKTAEYFNIKKITLKELKGSHLQEFYDTLATTIANALCMA